MTGTPDGYDKAFKFSFDARGSNVEEIMQSIKTYLKSLVPSHLNPTFTYEVEVQPDLEVASDSGVMLVARWTATVTGVVKFNWTEDSDG